MSEQPAHIADLIRDLRRCKSGGHCGESTAEAIARGRAEAPIDEAIAMLQMQAAIIAPLARIGDELLRAEGGDSWKVEIPEDRVIFSFCGQGVTAGHLRAAAALCAQSRHSPDPAAAERAQPQAL